MPASLGGLRTVIRVGRAGTLAPAGRAAGVDADQDVVEVHLSAGAGLERPNQRQPHDSELDLVDPHGFSLSKMRTFRKHSSPSIPRSRGPPECEQ